MNTARIDTDIKNLIQNELYRAYFDDVLEEIIEIEHNFDKDYHSIERDMGDYYLSYIYEDLRDRDAGDFGINFTYSYTKYDLEIELDHNDSCYIPIINSQYLILPNREINLFKKIRDDRKLDIELLVHGDPELKHKAYDIINQYKKVSVDF